MNYTANSVKMHNIKYRGKKGVGGTKNTSSQHIIVPPLFPHICSLFLSLSLFLFLRRSVVLQTQKRKTHLLRTQSSKVLPFESRAGPYMVMHATPTARDFFHASFYNSGQFICIFPKTLQSFLCWLWLTPVPMWVCRIK